VRHDRPLGAPQQVAGRLVGLAFDLAEDERGPIFLRQLADFGVEHRTQLAPGHILAGLDRGGGGPVLAERLLEGGPLGGLGPGAEGDPVGHGVQSAPEQGASADRSPLRARVKKVA
jgi:hypothetical protein